MKVTTKVYTDIRAIKVCMSQAEVSCIMLFCCYFLHQNQPTTVQQCYTGKYSLQAHWCLCFRQTDGHFTRNLKLVHALCIVQACGLVCGSMSQDVLSYLREITAAPKPGTSPTSGASMTRATAWMCKSEILGTMRVASPPIGSSMAMAMLASPAHLNAICMLPSLVVINYFYFAVQNFALHPPVFGFAGQRPVWRLFSIAAGCAVL